MKGIVYALLGLFLLFSCDSTSTDCSAVSCLGPPVFNFEVLLNNENALENGTFTQEDISLTGTDANQFLLDLSSIRTNSGDITTLRLDNANWEPKTYTLQLVFGSEFSVDLQIALRLSQGDCCGGIPVLEQTTIDNSAQSGNSDGLYSIVLN